MKTSAIVFMLIATAGSIYLTTTSVIEATDVTRGAVARRENPAVAHEKAADQVSGLLETLSSPILGEDEESLSRDPMTPYRAPQRTTTTSTTTTVSRPGIRVMALILDENPTAVVRYRGSNMAVRAGDPIGSARVREVTESGITIEDEQGVHTYPYPPRG